jgi:hypothetical protein
MKKFIQYLIETDKDLEDARTHGVVIDYSRSDGMMKATAKNHFGKVITTGSVSDVSEFLKKNKITKVKMKVEDPFEEKEDDHNDEGY